MDGGELEATEDPLFATDKEIGTAGEEAATTAGGAGRQAIVGTPSEEGSLINHAHDLLRTITESITTGEFAAVPTNASTAKFSQHHSQTTTHDEGGLLPLVSSPQDAKDGGEREDIGDLLFTTDGGVSHHCKASSHDDGPRAFVSGQHDANDGGGGYGDPANQHFMMVGGLMEKGDTSSGCGILGEELLTPAITTRVFSAAPASASTKFSHLSQASHAEEGLLLLVSSPHDAKKDGDERENIVYPHFITVGGASHHCKASSHDDGPRAFVSGQNSANDRGGGYGDNQLFMFIGGGGGGGGGGDPTENDVNRWSTLFIMVCFERCPWLSCAFLFTFSRSHLHIGHILSSFSWQLHSS